MTGDERLLRTDAEIRAAARVAASELEPITDEERPYLAALLAPIGEERRKNATGQSGVA